MTWRGRVPLPLRIKDRYAVVARAVLLILLITFVLSAGTLQAQRAGGAGRGGAGSAGHSGFHQRHSGSHNFRNNGYIYPFWDDEPFWYDESTWYDRSPQEELIVPPPAMMPPGAFRSARQQLPPADPKVIELPGSTNSGVSAAPALFILANGERIETRRYLLTHDSLYLTVARQQRTVPLSLLDINATIAADHERGIDLRIPADRGEISLSF